MKALLIRDIRLAVRAGGGFGLGLAFFLIVIVMVPFAVGADTGFCLKSHQEFCGLGRCWLACCHSIDCWRSTLKMGHSTCWPQRHCHLKQH